MSYKITRRPIDEFEGRQCPFCRGADQHNSGCWLAGHEHVYDDTFSKVGWRETLDLVKWRSPLV